MATVEIGKLRTRVQRWLKGEDPEMGRRRRRLVLGGLVLAVGWFIFGGQQGLFALAMSQREKAQLREQITQLQNDNKVLESQADALARDPQACEKTARERLQLMRPGEIIYRFQ
jgi:cell division protein FtsB